MSQTLVVPARFNGPARSGNGGFVSGALAERVPGHAGTQRRGDAAPAAAAGRPR